jgi:CPA1 family monovalent cation:H+ antiporter
MSPYHLIALLLTFAVLVAYINHRYVKMPSTIAIMFASLLISFFLIVMGWFGFHDTLQSLSTLLAPLNFHDLLINGMLSFLLFAGALTIDISHLRNQKWEIGILASLGTVGSALLVGYGMYWTLPLIGIHLSLLYCLLFGALISPTDPIAVLSIFKALKAPRDMTIFLEGESLFNDGVGIVIFLTIYTLAYQGGDFSISTITLLFLRQAIGGILYGALLGLIGYWLIEPVDDHRMQILVTLALVTGGYALAMYLDISGPLAMVVAGIFIGNQSREFYMSPHTRENLDNFWEVMDEILNAVLFLLIGFELLQLNINLKELIAMGLAIVLVLLVRFICVAVPIHFFRFKRQYFPGMVRILTWGGLRGGLAVALALALPAVDTQRGVVLAMTYGVVVFAILIQGMTIKPMIKKSLRLQSVEQARN